MGREIRRVPGNWEHPRDKCGNFIPLFDGADYIEEMRDWEKGSIKWEQGLVKCGKDDSWIPIDSTIIAKTYEEWAGEHPIKDDYMPVWSESERTHIMMYETCTEGTPISPAFETPEDLAHWLADNDAPAFGGMTATYEQWLSVCRRGWAPSAYIDAEGVHPGVALA